MVFRLLNRSLHFPGFRASCSNVDFCGQDFVVQGFPAVPRVAFPSELKMKKRGKDAALPHAHST